MNKMLKSFSLIFGLVLLCGLSKVFAANYYVSQATAVLISSSDANGETGYDMIRACVSSATSATDDAFLLLIDSNSQRVAAGTTPRPYEDTLYPRTQWLTVPLAFISTRTVSEPFVGQMGCYDFRDGAGGGISITNGITAFVVATTPLLGREWAIYTVPTPHRRD